jgi:hypothetical protein
MRIHRIIPAFNLSGLKKDQSAMDEFMPQGEKMQANRLIISWAFIGVISTIVADVGFW